MDSYNNGMRELSVSAVSAITAGSYFYQPSRKLGGYHYVVRYPNGYGASIIKHFGSYGGELNLWEVAVLRQEEDGLWHLCYDTEITDDVLGFLSEADVVDACRRICALV